MKNFLQKYASFKIVILYAVLAGLWIFFSDNAINLLFDNKELVVKFSLYKGFFFVTVTSLLLYLLVSKELARHKKSETALRENEFLLKQLIDESPIAIILSDGRTKTTTLNRQFTNLLGYTIDDIPGIEEWWKLAYPDEKYRSKIIAEWSALTEEARNNKETNPSLLVNVTCKSGRTKIIKFYFAQIGAMHVAALIDQTEQSENESALIEREEKYRTLFDSMAQGVFYQSAEGSYIDVNTAALNIFGLSREEFLSRSSFTKEWKFINEYGTKITPKQLPGIRALMTGTVIQNSILGIFNKTLNNYLWVNITAYPKFKEGESQPYQVFVILDDITAQRSSINALRESEEKYKSLVENSPDAIGVYHNNRMLYLNNSGIKIIGAKNFDELREIPVSDFIHPDYREAANERMKSVLLKNVLFPLVEEKLIRMDGTVIDVEVQTMSSVFQGKKVAQFIIRDISERKKVTAELRLLAQAVSSIKDCVSITDFNNNLIFVNDAFLKLYGYEREELIGRNISAVISSPDPSKIIPDVLEKTYNGGWYGEIENRKKDGTKFPIELWTSLIYDDSKKPIAMIGVARDVTERKFAELSLQHSLERNNAIINAVPDLLFEITDDGYILNYKGLNTEDLYVPPEQFLGKKIEMVLPSEVAEKTHSAIKNALQNSTVEIFEYTLIIKNKLLFFEDRIAPLSDKKVLSIIRNITERKHFEEELRINERRLKKAQAMAHVGNWEINIASQTAWASEEALSIYGYDPASNAIPMEVVKSSRLPQYNSILDEAMKNLIEKDEPYNVQYEIRRQNDGEIRSISSRAELVRDKNGAPLLVQGVLQDITEMRKAELAALTSETNFRAIFNSVNDGVFLHDIKTYKILSVNERMLEMFGYTEEEARTITVQDISAGTSPYSIKEAIQLLRTAATGKPVITEWQAKHKSGKLFWAEISIKKAAIGGAENILVLVRDIQERKEAEEEKQKLQEQLFQIHKAESIGTLAAGIAHDFNNLLNIILANAELLATKYETNSSALKYITSIAKSTERGAKLVRQLLTYARKSEIQHTSVHINEIIQDIEKIIHETFPKSISLAVHLQQNLPVIFADTTQLHQVLLNLCINARDAMDENGTIEISTALKEHAFVRQLFPQASEPQYILISITDNGIGIEKERLSRIFEPFFTTKAPGKGTGLGLSVVFGIVKSHKGFVTVESEVGKGTTFYVYFPVHNVMPAAETVEERQEQSAVPKGKNETVLIVEDEELLVELIRSMLEANGYSVLSAANGEEGIETFIREQQNISLVISDLGLPKANGITVLKEIKKISPKMKFILASGFIEPSERAVILELGADLIINKPYDLQSLLRKVRSLLDKKA